MDFSQSCWQVDVNGNERDYWAALMPDDVDAYEKKVGLSFVGGPCSKSARKSVESLYAGMMCCLSLSMARTASV